MLTTVELVDTLSIEKTDSASLLSMPRSQIDRTIKSIWRDKTELKINDPLTTALMDLIKNYLELIKPDIVKSLYGTEVYVLPQSLCGAFARKFEGREIIVIGSGIIDLVETMAFTNQFIGHLPGVFGSIHPFEVEVPGYTLHSMCNQLFFSLLYGFYSRTDPLPNFIELCDDKMIEAARSAFAAGMTFMLLHELGHLSCGHLSTEEPRISQPTFGISQTLSLRQKQEIEADEFASSAFKNEVADMVHYFSRSAFDFFIRLEVLTTQVRELHPLTINRMFHINETFDAPSKYHNPESSSEFLKHISKNFEESKIAGISLEEIITLPRDTIASAILHFRSDFTDQKIDIDKIFRPASNWYDHLSTYGPPNLP